MQPGKRISRVNRSALLLVGATAALALWATTDYSSAASLSKDLVTESRRGSITGDGSFAQQQHNLVTAVPALERQGSAAEGGAAAGAVAAGLAAGRVGGGAAAAAAAATQPGTKPGQWGRWHAEAQADQEAFCNQLPAVVNDEPFPEKVDVPSGGSANGTQLQLLHHLQPTEWAGDSQLFDLFVYTSSDVVSGVLAKRGTWEDDLVEETMDRLLNFAGARHLQREQVLFLDVGANVGAMSVAVAASGFQVLAFEPLPTNLVALRHSLCANSQQLRSRVALVPKGLGNAAEHCSIYSGAGNVGDGIVFCGAKDPPKFEAGTDYAKRGELEVVRLDDFLLGSFKPFVGRVAAVKIDVEGNELAVLEGGREFFQAVKPPLVVAECNDDMMLRATGKPASALLVLMSELGYSVKRGNPYSQPLAKEALADVKESDVVNYWFELAATQQ